MIFRLSLIIIGLSGSLSLAQEGEGESDFEEPAAREQEGAKPSLSVSAHQPAEELPEAEDQPALEPAPPPPPPTPRRVKRAAKRKKPRKVASRQAPEPAKMPAPASPVSVPKPPDATPPPPAVPSTRFEPYNV